MLAELDGIIVPGGFGSRGIEGMILAAQYARENFIPYFGICLGMQIAVIEYARNVAGIRDAHSGEFDELCKNKVINFMPGQSDDIDKGGTLRLGAYPCVIKENTTMQRCYGTLEISERHRHRYEFNNDYREILTKNGLTLSGLSPDGRLVETVELTDRPFYVGVQFHPEVELSVEGQKVLQNFLFKICKANADYDLGDYIERKIKEVRETVGTDTVILGLSGGVDSSVAATLLSRAIGKQLICIFVDHGFMRQDEGDEIESIFSKMDLHFVRVDAEARFLKKLEGVTDPERKRKIIGAEFAHVFEEEARKFENARYLAQGTIYPDIIESGGKHNAVIKSHHNVGGLPEKLNFKGVVEPLNGLFKNEVRIVGKKLGLPDFLINRQPFPGPGLAVRVMGEVTKEKCDILRKADKIYREEIEKSKVKTSQYFAVLTGVKTVGVMGDYRTYDYLVALRAVNTSDFMTAQYTPIPHRLLAKISSRIVNEVKGINRVCYDITSKPPSTIEWE